MLLVTLVYCTGYGDKLSFKGTLKNGVIAAQTTQLGDYLITSKFADGNKKSVQFVSR